MTLGCVYCSVSSRELFVDAYFTINTSTQTPAPTISFREKLFHKCIVYLWVLCSSVGLALSGLTLWHIVLILCGETSIERHINKKERQRQQKKGRLDSIRYLCWVGVCLLNVGAGDNRPVFWSIELQS
ncbi:hypothetical protein scyTo_0010024 [Scyliorhinus torazame]|uniref:Uncharacterized protein n=1 Tax=Scyliorhinus torazame TaxID=75743 RepID=A0A401NYB9_SCYTO|nr:hypothetical protein [Scyliorhinus torazame]